MLGNLYQRGKSGQETRTSSPAGPPSSKTSWRYEKCSIWVRKIVRSYQKHVRNMSQILLGFKKYIKKIPPEHHRGQAGQEAVAVPLGSCAHRHHSDCSEVRTACGLHTIYFTHRFTSVLHYIWLSMPFLSESKVFLIWSCAFLLRSYIWICVQWVFMFAHTQRITFLFFIFAKNGCLLCTERHCNSLLHSHWPYSPLHTPDTKSLPLPKIVFHLNFDDYHIKWWEESDVIYLGFINFFYITKTWTFNRGV